jgi:hypothetical protein
LIVHDARCYFPLMTDETLRLPLRIVSLVVIAIMAAALLYTVYISLANWSSIAV